MKARTIPNLKSLAEVVEHIEGLQRSGYQPVGNWSLGQVCNHLAAAIDLTTGGLARLMPRFMQRLFVGTFLRLTFLGKLGNMLGLRVPTNLPQNEPVDDEVGIERLKASVGRLESAAHLIDFHLWHSCHHLSFLAAKTSEDGAIHRQQNAKALV